jgi:hypothetical protein
MVFILVVGALADLRLTTEMVGLRVRAALRNEGPAPVTLTVGDKCAGPTPFRLIVDGKPRPFAAAVRLCTAPRPIVRTLPPGGEYALLSDSLDGRHHLIEARFGDVAAPPLRVETSLRVGLTVAATAVVPEGKPVDVEIVHVNRSPEEVVLPVCGEDRLLVDGHELPLPPAPGERCDGQTRSIRVRGAFVTRGRLALAAGRHRLRARWRETQSNDVTVDVTPAGH